MSEGVTGALSPRHRLSTKIVGLVGLSVAAVSVALLWSFDRRVTRAFNAEIEERGRAVTLGLANGLVYELFTTEKDGLNAAARATLRDIADTVYVVFLDAKGSRLAEAQLASSEQPSGARSAEAAPPEMPKSPSKLLSRRLRWKDIPVIELSAPVFFEERARGGVGGEPLFDPVEPAAAPAGTESAPEGQPRRTVGYVQVGFRLDHQEALIASMNVAAAITAAVALCAALLAAFFLTRRLTVPIERLRAAAAGIAAGDFRQQVAVEGNDEIADLASSFSTMAKSLQSILVDLRTAASEMDREAGHILETSSKQTAVVSRQSASLGEASTTVTNIARTARAATGHADAVISVAQTSADLSRDGQRVVSEAVSGMEKLGEQVRAMALTIADLSDRTVQISTIMTTLRDLAEQSTLLALNASIEASRAGEHGRGFAVVAQEMRTLADQSRTAAQEVRGLLFEVQKGTRAAVAAAEEGGKRAQAASTLAKSAGRSIEGLRNVISESSQVAQQIAASSRDQSSGVEQVAATITGLADGMGARLEDTRRIEAVAGNLKELSVRLTQLVGRYQG